MGNASEGVTEVEAFPSDSSPAFAGDAARQSRSLFKHAAAASASPAASTSSPTAAAAAAAASASRRASAGRGKQLFRHASATAGDFRDARSSSVVAAELEGAAASQAATADVAAAAAAANAAACEAVALAEAERSAEAKRSVERAKVFLELLDTERSYVDDLSTLIDVFLRPLQLASPPLLAPAQMRTIFSNCEVLLGVNRALLQSLEDSTATGPGAGAGAEGGAPGGGGGAGGGAEVCAKRSCVRMNGVHLLLHWQRRSFDPPSPCTPVPPLAKVFI